MAEKQTSKYFFRQDIIDADIGLVDNVPPDVEWAVQSKKPIVPKVNDSSSNREEGPTDLGEYQPWTPNQGPQVPQFLGILKQEVSQDPQGNSRISVTFVVTDISDVEYETRFTRG